MKFERRNWIRLLTQKKRKKNNRQHKSSFALENCQQKGQSAGKNVKYQQCFLLKERGKLE